MTKTSIIDFKKKFTTCYKSNVIKYCQKIYQRLYACISIPGAYHAEKDTT